MWAKPSRFSSCLSQIRILTVSNSVLGCLRFSSWLSQFLFLAVLDSVDWAVKCFFPAGDFMLPAQQHKLPVEQHKLLAQQHKLPAQQHKMFGREKKNAGPIIPISYPNFLEFFSEKPLKASRQRSVGC